MARCKICYLPIHERKSQLNCPRCFNEFHRDHLAAWLLEHENCPICRETLSEAFREELRPKTAQERKRLEDIMITLDSMGDRLNRLESSGKFKRRIRESRREEFGIEKTSISELITISLPFIFLIAAAVFILIAFTSL